MLLDLLDGGASFSSARNGEIWMPPSTMAPSAVTPAYTAGVTDHSKKRRARCWFSMACRVHLQAAAMAIGMAGYGKRMLSSRRRASLRFFKQMKDSNGPSVVLSLSSAWQVSSLEKHMAAGHCDNNCRMVLDRSRTPSVRSRSGLASR